jgi:hypothetical protein
MEKKDTVSLYVRTANNTGRIIKGKIKRGDSKTLKKFIRTYLYKNKARIFLTIILIYFSLILLYLFLF